MQSLAYCKPCMLALFYNKQSKKEKEEKQDYVLDCALFVDVDINSSFCSNDQHPLAIRGDWGKICNVILKVICPKKVFLFLLNQVALNRLDLFI